MFSQNCGCIHYRFPSHPTLTEGGSAFNLLYRLFPMTTVPTHPFLETEGLQGRVLGVRNGKEMEGNWICGTGCKVLSRGTGEKIRSSITFMRQLFQAACLGFTHLVSRRELSML